MVRDERHREPAGRCRVHRAEILRLRGSCNEAEAQALVACEELRPTCSTSSGGRWTSSDGSAFTRETSPVPRKPCWPSRAGWDPQPALALVRLAQGDVAAAAASIRAPSNVLCGCRRGSGPGHRPAARAAAPGAGGDRGRGWRHQPGSNRPPTSWRSWPTASVSRVQAFVASAALARGRVRLAEGDAAGAEQSLSEALGLWNEVGAPYEAALTRLCLAEAIASDRQPAPGRFGASSGPHNP